MVTIDVDVISLQTEYVILYVLEDIYGVTFRVLTFAFMCLEQSNTSSLNKKRIDKLTNELLHT